MSEEILILQKKKALLDPKIELFLEFEGQHASTNFVDSSNYKKSISIAGSGPRLDSSLFKHGSSSCYFPVGTSYLNIPQGVIGGLSSRDFCVEAWVLWGSTGAYDALCHIGPGGGGDYSGILIVRNGVFAANAAGTNWGMFLNPAFSDIPTNNGFFQHIALVRRSGTFRLFHKGIKQGNDVTPGYIPKAVNPSWVRVGNQATAGQFGGYVDSFKITVDDYVYWENFTPE